MKHHYKPIKNYIINGRNVDDLKALYQHIIWMYYDLASSYGTISHNVDFEAIEYKKYICTITDDLATDYSIDMANLVRNGAIIALCCDIYNLLCDEQRDSDLEKFLFEIVNSQHLIVDSDLTQLTELAINAFKEPISAFWESTKIGSKLRHKMDYLYNKNVNTFFDELVSK